MSGLTSNRASTRTVWRTVLANPLSVDWPPEAFAHPSEVSAWLGTYVPSPSSLHGRKRRRQLLLREEPTSLRTQEPMTEPARPQAKKEPEQEPEPEQEQADASMDLDSPMQSKAQNPASVQGESRASALMEGEAATGPDVPPSAIAGISNVLRYLEDKVVHAARNEKGASRRDVPRRPDAVLLVCKQDVSPTSLVAPIPLACATAHAAGFVVHLATLPRGSEPLVAHSLGLRRAAAVLIPLPTCSRSPSPACGWPGTAVRVPLLDAALAPSRPPSMAAGVQLRSAPALPIRIKHLRSVAPVNMNKARQAKKEKRAERKRRSRIEAQALPPKESGTNATTGATGAPKPQPHKHRPTPGPVHAPPSSAPTPTVQTREGETTRQQPRNLTARTRQSGHGAPSTIPPPSSRSKTNPFAKEPSASGSAFAPSTAGRKDDKDVTQPKSPKPPKKGLKGIL